MGAFQHKSATRRAKSGPKMEQKLRTSMENIPLLNVYAQAASLRLRSNTYDNTELAERAKTAFYRTVLTFTLQWKSALRKS